MFIAFNGFKAELSDMIDIKSYFFSQVECSQPSVDLVLNWEEAELTV